MFYSQSAYDGWVLETGENTNAGGLLNTDNLICNIGDDRPEPASTARSCTLTHLVFRIMR